MNTRNVNGIEVKVLELKCKDATYIAVDPSESSKVHPDYLFFKVEDI